MVDFLKYLVNVSICSAAFYTFYYIFLRKETFFVANRVYLMVSLLLSFIVPFIDVGSDLQLKAAPITISNYVPDYFETETFVRTAMPDKWLTWELALGCIYVAGVLVILARMGFLIGKIARLVRTLQSSKTGKNRFVLLNNGSMPFSFFHYIFIDPAKIREAHLSKPVIEHEMVHARQLHSLDILIAEFVSALLWFNPFAFFYRNSIRENHEYLADSGVVRSGADPLDYIVTLANEVFKNHSVGLTSNFNCSITKKRLLMITKIGSKKKNWFKFVFILPLVCIMLVAFARPSLKPTIFNFIKPIKADSLADETPSIMPVEKSEVKKVSGWGWRTHPIYKIRKFHAGIDFTAPKGTPIYATAAGFIECSEQKTGEGIYLIIKHNYHYKTLYSHLKDYVVRKGDIVYKGQLIGHVGNTGVLTGPHLHYEVIKDGKNVNPEKYISKQ
jgi:hypothetical protein